MAESPIVQWEFLRFTGRSITNPPEAAFLQSMTQIGSKLLLYGGCNYDGEPLEQLFV